MAYLTVGRLTIWVKIYFVANNTIGDFFWLRYVD
jgi:hypothetical protein